MKRNVLSLFFLISIVLFVLVDLSSCRVGRDMPKDISTYILENKDDNLRYFIKLDSVYGSNAKGKMYLLHNDLVLKPVGVKISLFKRRCEIVTSESDTYILKFKRISKDFYEGNYTKSYSSDKMNFVLYPYVDDDEILFETDRYRKEVFEVERITDINYANVKGFWSSIPDDTIDVAEIVRMSLFNSLKKKDLNLNMDVYLPKNDTLSKRPLIMFIHGGAFFVGDKAVLPYQKWCTHFASLGYVCVSINYRMGFWPNSKAIERTAYQATQDAHAAMRFLLSKKDIYRIDEDCIFVGGTSAGAITAMNMAYMRNENRPQSTYSSFFNEDLGNIETSGNNIRKKFKIKAVANMWGGIYDLGMLKNSKTPIVSFHGDRDDILPYKFGYPFSVLGEFQKVFFDEMYGSYYIHETAKKLGTRSELHTFYGEGHALHLDENRKICNNFYKIQNEIVDFFYDELVPNKVCIVRDKDDIQRFVIDATSVQVADWDVVGGVLIDESKGEIRASWFDDEPKQELKVSGYYNNGASFKDVFVIKNDENENNTYK